MAYMIDKEDFGFNEIDDEFVVFDIRNDNYHIMNESAQEILKMFLENDKCDIGEILKKFREIYELANIDEDEVEKDIERILQEFLRIGLIKSV